jgi:hypothetical protein
MFVWDIFAEGQLYPFSTHRYFTRYAYHNGNDFENLDVEFILVPYFGKSRGGRMRL